MALKFEVTGGPYPHAIGEIGTAIHKGDGAFWLEFEDIVFEDVDPETQHPNRSWFFLSEIRLLPCA